MSDRVKFVFCEGGDDLAVVSGVAKSVGLSDLRIEPFLGKDKLRVFLEDVQKRPEFAQEKSPQLPSSAMRTKTRTPPLPAYAILFGLTGSTPARNAMVMSSVRSGKSASL